MPGSWAHLARRFVWSLRVAPLKGHEIEELAGLVDRPTLDAFLGQAVTDQRHGYEAARHVRDRHGRPELVVASLLHDLGKRHAGLGTAGRVVASVLSRLGLPAPGRLGVYLDHPRLGADELRELGHDPLTVDFAAHHHGSRPGSIAPADWAMLSEADSTFTGGGPSDN